MLEVSHIRGRWTCIWKKHEGAETMKAANDSAQQLIMISITNMQSNDLARTKTKFEVAYFVAKEEMPISKYPWLLHLEEKQGVDLRKAYHSEKSCNMFIAHIEEELGNFSISHLD